MLTGKCKEDEIVRDVHGYSDFYMISNYGAVISKERKVNCGYGKKRTIKQKELKPYINRRTGYLYVDFNINGYRTKHLVHRLVAYHFVKGVDITKEVNHKDCNKLNNHYLNLEWVTRSENTQHAYDNGLINTSGRGGYRHGKRKRHES